MTKQMNKPLEKPIYITRPIMPDYSDLTDRIQNLYETRMLTNLGPYHQALEIKLQEYLKVKYLSLFNNATIGLITALKALDLPYGSEVITTPFTFAATPHAIVWNGLQPVFCDIEPGTMTIDPDEIENLITPKTSAILAVHVYGFPCNVEQISRIAIEHNIRVIYDSAHAFTTEINQNSICNYGDISVLSFHATKLFNTFEGGALVCEDPKIHQRINNLRNFGIQDEFTVTDIGINGKMNELQSLIGLLNLDLVKEEQHKRFHLSELYKNRLASMENIVIPEMPANTTDSFQYYPILINDHRDLVYNVLRKFNIHARKYFYPPCTEYDCYKGLGNRKSLPVTYEIADRVLCLPFYGELGEENANMICDIIINTLQNAT